MKKVYFVFMSAMIALLFSGCAGLFCPEPPKPQIKKADRIEIDRPKITPICDDQNASKVIQCILKNYESQRGYSRSLFEAYLDATVEPVKADSSKK